MTKIIVVSFTEETKAIEALHKLNELDALGDISIYEKVMFRKRSNSEAEVLNDTSSEGWRTLAGMSIGGLLGIIGGPIGVLIGLAGGTVVGGIAEAEHYDFSDNFISSVKARMVTGSIAIIAEIDEESEIFVDNSMKGLDGIVIRNNAGSEWEDYDQSQLDGMDAEIEGEEHEFDKSVSTEKEKIKSRIADLKAKRENRVAGVKARMERNKNKLKEQMANLKSKVNTKFIEHKEIRIKDKIAKYEEKLGGLKKKLETV